MPRHKDRVIDRATASHRATDNEHRPSQQKKKKTKPICVVWIWNFAGDSSSHTQSLINTLRHSHDQYAMSRRGGQRQRRIILRVYASLVALSNTRELRI